MYIDFSHLFHNSSKDHIPQGSANTPLEQSEWPEEWKKVEYKSYDRTPKIALPDVHPEGTLEAAIRARSSARDKKGRSPSIEDLACILRYSCGTVQNAKRAYPSAGGLYPIEAYPMVLRGSENLSSGTYHYNVRDHSLNVLSHASLDASDIKKMYAYEWVQESTLSIVLTAMFGRTQQKYQERGYRYVLLEAGHIGQNISLTAAALGIRCSAVGGTWDKEIERRLGIDGVTESVVYTLVLG